MSKYFAENPGKIEVLPWYANNEICLREVRFSVPASEWNEFLKSDLFRQLEEYVDSLKTPDMHTDIHEQEYTAGIEESRQNRTYRVTHESFWAQVRKWIHGKKWI